MKIGRFAWENGVSLRQLRNYDELGLLHPAALTTWRMAALVCHGFAAFEHSSCALAILKG